MTRSHRQIDIASFAVTDFDAVIDVRSPAEYAEDHLPGAINAWVLDDAQRAEIGTLYKQVSPFAARKKGAVLVARNIARHIETLFADHPKTWRPLVYCWRGGQRSGAMQIVLSEIGWNAVQLVGGYKAYRHHVLEQLEILPQRFRYIVIGGPTGSGKTRLLQALIKQGAQGIDLEGLARHKGSVLGLKPDETQPNRKAFDSALLNHFKTFDPARPIFVESESRRIGTIHLPGNLFTSMRQGAVVCLNPALPARVDFLIRDYDYFLKNTVTLIDRLRALKGVQSRDIIEKWSNLANAGAWNELVESLLVHHYDPLYRRSVIADYPGGLIETLAPPRLDDHSFSELAKKLRTQLDIPSLPGVISG